MTTSDNRYQRAPAGSREPLGAAFLPAALFTLAIAYGGGLWLHLLHEAEGAHELHRLPLFWHWLRDATLALPLLFAATLAALQLARLLLARHGTAASPLLAAAVRAATVAAATSLAAALASPIHGLLFEASHGGHELSLVAHMARDGLLAMVANLALASAVALLLDAPRALTRGWRPSRRQIQHLGVQTVRVGLAALVALSALPLSPLLPAPTAVAASPSSVECTAANVDRTYDVAAVNVIVPFNRWGDVNPHGKVYVLQQDKEAVRYWAFPLSEDTPAGNRRLRPRPLVLRANEGECVKVTFTNELGNQPPVLPEWPEEAKPTIGDEGLPANPRASIHVHGPSFNVQTSDGSRVGFNADTTAGHGESLTYYWRAPEKEGLFYFHDHGTLAGSEADGGSNAHGLYGALAVEPAGSLWLDPESGNPLYTGTVAQSGELYINAVIVPPAAQGNTYDGSIPDLRAPSSVAFRESIQITQDEMPGVHLQAAVTPGLELDFGMGLGFNYGEEHLLLRQEPINRCPDCVGEETWLSSWPFGDPSLVKLASGLGPWYPAWHPLFPGNDGVQQPGRYEDPEDCGLADGCYTSNVTHAYKFDPQKIRFLHAGPKETHVFHMHAHQWLSDPFDVANTGATPGQPGDDGTGDVNARRPEAATIDSQTFGPTESYTADLLFGAGSKPGTVGDSIFHCHLYPHFAEGFWALYRVHDVLQDGTGRTPDGVVVRALQPLPDRGDLAPLPDEFNPGYPHFLPGTFGWRAPQPLYGISEPNGAADVSGTLVREDLQPATRIVAGKGLYADLLDKTQAIWNDAGGGTFTLTFTTGKYGAETTAALPHDATAAQVAAALKALQGIVNVEVTGDGTAGDPWVVKLLLWSKAPSLVLAATDSFSSGATTVTPDPALSDPVSVAIAYQLAIERNVTLLNHNPGYDPASPPAEPKQPKPGAPIADPCPAGAREVTYNVSIIQRDVVYNEAGWHDTQARFLVLDKDVDAVLAGTKPAEPLFFRVNAGDCVNFNLTNRLPNFFGDDDFLKLIQTNMVGQHIHLVKFDVLASDGSSNGWNNQQAAFSEEQREFDAAVLAGTQYCGPDIFDGVHLTADGCRVPAPPPGEYHPLFQCDSIAGCPKGQTIHERWYADYELRTVFTHDHHFPAEDQNRGYFGALVVEPSGMDVRNSFSGEYLPPINDPAHGAPCGTACEGFAAGTHLDIIGPGPNDDFREFSLAIQDFVSLYRPCPAGETCGPDGTISSAILGQQPLNQPEEPEDYPDDDPGVFGINYRNAPLQLRDTKNGAPVDPAYWFSSFVHGDPKTPLLQAYAGDPVRVRLIQGSQEEQHVFQIHGMRWREEPDDPGSPLVNARAIGISEAFNFEVPRMECAADEDCRGDYLYSGTSTDDLWLGAWGILRVFGKGVQGLLPLPDNIPQAVNGNTHFPVTGNPPPKANKPGNACPADAPLRRFEVVAVDAPIVYNEFGHNDPYGLVYAAVEPDETISDTVARVRAGNPEPMVLRANEGDCVEVALTNKIDPDGRFATEHAPFGAHETDPRGGDPPLVLEPPTGTPAGLRVSLHPALLRYDVRYSDGATIGFNRDQTVGPDESILYRWWADDVTPGELGAINLTDYGDLRGHRHHGLFAGLTVEPKHATYHDPLTGAELLSGAIADIRVPGQPDFREFSAFFQDGLNLRDTAGNPLPDALDHPPTPEEPFGELPDPEDRGEKGFNYRNATFHGRLPAAPGEALDDLDGTALAHVFSSVEHGDPWTPVLRAYAGDPVRMRVLQGADKPRQHTVNISGHAWQRQPFDDPATTEIVGSAGGFSVGRALNILLPGAGGPAALIGDYRYNCGVLSHHQSGGLWGIIRVYPRPAPAAVFTPDTLKAQDNPHDQGAVGYYPLMPLEQAQITALVFDDGNMNGTRQNGESLVTTNVTVTLRTTAGTALETRTTGANGQVTFQAAPGAYDLTVVEPEDWAATTPATYRVDATGENAHGYGEFGMVQLADVAIRVFDDKNGSQYLDGAEPALAGWSVTLSGGGQTLSGTTDADGIVAFDGLKPGSYQANVAGQPGWLATRQLPVTVPITENASLQPPDEVQIGFALKAGLSVKLFNDADEDGVQDPGESSLAGWTVIAAGGPPELPVVVTATTNANGIAVFDDPDPALDGLRPGTYTITQQLKPDWSCANASVQTTWPDGSLAAAGPDPCPGGSYTTVLNEETTHVVTLGNHNPNVSLVAVPFNDTNNDGQKQDKDSKLVGWTVDLYDSGGTNLLATTTTGNDGRAVFYPYVGGSYVLKMSPPPHSSDPTVLDWTATTPGAVALTVIPGETGTGHFGFVQLGTVGAVVFHDHDKDGVWDDNEPPLANRNARLYDKTGKKILGQAATDAGGRVAFQVAAGTDYQIEVLLPNGWTATTPKANNGSPTTKVKVTGPKNTESVEVQYGQYAENDTTPPPAPVASPPGGTYNSAQSVTLESETGATIRYTIDGSTPSATAGTLYAGPIAVGSSLTLKAIAIDGAGNLSPVTTESYTIQLPATETATGTPSAWTMLKGSVASGSAADLAADDGAYLVLSSAKQGRNQLVDGYGSYTVPSAQRDLVGLSVTYDGGASVGSATRKLSLYNFATSAWEVVKSEAQTAADLATTVVVSGDPKRFLSAGGELRMRVEAANGASFQLKADQMAFTLTYQP